MNKMRYLQLGPLPSGQSDQRTNNEHQWNELSLNDTLPEAFTDGSASFWLDIQAENMQKALPFLKQIHCHDVFIKDSIKTRMTTKAELCHGDTFLSYRCLKDLDTELDFTTQTMICMILGKMFVTLHIDESSEVQKLQSDMASKHIKLLKPAILMFQLLKTSSIFYSDALEDVEETLTELEEKITLQGDDSLLDILISYRLKLRRLKRTFSYHEALTLNLEKNNHNWPETKTDDNYLPRDVYSRYERLLSLTNMYYDLCGDLYDSQLSITSYRLNRIMQFLAIITAVFSPLMLIAGIYGMNFQHMPELHYKAAYPIALITMAVTAAVSVFFLKRKHWF